MDQGADASGQLYAAILVYLEATERGEPPDLDALADGLADRPALAQELREFAAAHAQVEELTAPLRQTAQAPRLRRPPRTATAAAATPG